MAWRSTIYLYDPDLDHLTGWQRIGSRLIEIAEMNGWRSPLMEIRFELTEGDLHLYYPDGRRFLTHVELDQRHREVETRAQAEAQARTLEAQAQKYEAI